MGIGNKVKMTSEIRSPLFMTGRFEARIRREVGIFPMSIKFP